MCSQKPDRRVFAVLKLTGPLAPCCCVCSWFIRLFLSMGPAACSGGDSHQGLYFSVSVPASLLRSSCNMLVETSNCDTALLILSERRTPVQEFKEKVALPVQVYPIPLQED